MEHPKKCPACQSPLWNTPYRRNVKASTRNIDKEQEPAIIATMDPDGAMMRVVPLDRVAEAKKKAMELFRKVSA